MASGHRWNSVGDEFVRYLTAAYVVDGKVHWPTLISGSATLCGEAALMANEARLPEFGIVDSRKLAEFIHDGKAGKTTIWGYATTIAQEALGIEVGNLPSYEATIKQLGTQLLPGSFPALSSPAHIMPRQTPMNAGPLHRKSIYSMATKAELNTEDCAFALATATMKMVGTAQILGVRDLTILALQSIVAGSRFVPLYDPATNPAEGEIAQPASIMEAAHTKAGETEIAIPTAEMVAAVLSTKDDRDRAH
jgi:hypothetical protein